MLKLPAQVDMQTVIKNSYKDFHTKGLDYICLYRSAAFTLKIYMMEGVVSSAPEVVNPHDHRYTFDSVCLAGRMTNHRFMIPPDEWRGGETYQSFDYMTPLNGGKGFTDDGLIRLAKLPGVDYTVGEKYRMHPGELHTIQVHGAETALMLLQYEDQVAIDEPTKTYARIGTKAPSIGDPGLYSRFTADQIRASMKKLARIANINVEIV